MKAPYGSWKSPITTDLIVAETIGIGGQQFHKGELFWAELRPQEGGRLVLVRRDADGRVASLDEIHETVLHEMGHALGLMGHSDDPNDIMFPSVTHRTEKGLSDRDRRTLAALYEHGNRQIRGRRDRRY